MGTTLHTLAPNPGATKNKKRIGRGPGSGTGKTSGKGMKGQRARADHHGPRIGFEGGQMPMQRRLPKRGFKNPFREEAYPINVGVLERHFQSGGVVDLEALKGVGLIPKGARIVKILAGGEVNVVLTVKAHRFSRSAIAKLEAAGGGAEVIALSGAAESQQARTRSHKSHAEA
jgi:large subunit ribosomal protein L15